MSERIADPTEAPLAEDFLLRMNDALGPLESAEYRDDVAPRPLVVVVGPPRSGTTLAVQLLASCLDVGFIDNLSASFWRAPTFGIRLSQKLLPRPFQSSFRSRFGRTYDVAEPHEFGYFWNHLLGFRGLVEPDERQRAAVDWEGLRLAVARVTTAFGAPWVLKGFHLTWLLDDFTKAVPASIVVRMRRDEVATARSILRLREEAFGGVETWASLRPTLPARPPTLTPEEQVANQVVIVNDSLSRQLDGLDASRLFAADLVAVQRDPAWFVEQVRRRLEMMGAPVAETNAPPSDLRSGAERHTPGASYQPDEARIATVIAGLRERGDAAALAEEGARDSNA